MTTAAPKFSEPSASPGEAPRILLVDDNKAVRTIIRKYLGTGYEVLEADNGEVALEMALRCRPDLVISDLTMPVMDGIEFVTRLRKLAGAVAATVARTPVVMLTSLKAHDACIAAGANDFVSKPVTSVALREIVSKYIPDAAAPLGA